MLVAVLIALGIGAVVVFIVSEDPMKAMGEFVLGPLSSIRRFGAVIEKAIPLTFTGVAICMMFQANMFNLVVEGSFLLSGLLSVAFVVSGVPLPGIVMLIIALVISIVSGIGCAFIPTILKAKWNANEVVASLMMNSVLLQIHNYILKQYLYDPTAGITATKEIPEAAKLPILVEDTRVHAGLFIAIAVAVLAYVFMYHTKWGYQIRMVGSNSAFARYSGISVMAVAVMSQLIGGAIAGMGGAVFALGTFTRYSLVGLTGHGFNGILLAILAKNNPLFVPITAFALGYLTTGAEIMGATTDVPLEIVQVVTSLIIMLVGAEMLLSGFKHKLIVKNAEKLAAAKEVK